MLQDAPYSKHKNLYPDEFLVKNSFCLKIWSYISNQWKFTLQKEINTSQKERAIGTLKSLNTHSHDEENLYRSQSVKTFLSFYSIVWN